MIAQTVLPFKLEITKDEVTPHAGLAVFGEFCHAMGLPQMVDRELPCPGSGAGYLPWQFVEPLLLMLHGGGRALEDMRQIRMDTGLRELLRMDVVPSSDATGDWLRRMGAGAGLCGLGSVNRQIVRRALNRDATDEYTLDIDATQIVAEKRDAKRTYKGEIGYMPMLGVLAENGLAVGDEFREGNDSPGARNLEFIEYCVSRMPRGKRIAHLRSDSAAYQARIFDWCEQNNASFAVGADLDSAVMEAIARIPEQEWREYQDGQVAETIHAMNRGNKAFRLVVIRRPIQRDLFWEEDPRLRYKVIASNREESSEETIAWYNQRGEAMENRIKELKLGFGMDRMPCGEIEANAVFFRIGVLAYNLFVLFKLLALPGNWQRHQVRTVRWRLYQTAGKVVTHAGALFLKIRLWMYNVFEEVRARCRELAWA